MLVAQTGLNLTQARNLHLNDFFYVGHLDGYQVKEYKKRRGGVVLFEIFKDYKPHFERYLDWRRHLFPDPERLFPFVGIGGSRPDSRCDGSRLRAICRALDFRFVCPRLLRNTRVNWLLRTTADPDLTAEMAQHAKQTMLKAGETWPLCFHQLRRTGAINMFASGLLSDSSIQVIMKHLTSLQTRYYGRNYSRLRFSEDYEGLTTAAKYEVLARQIKALVDDRYVSPLGFQRKRDIVINLIGSSDFTALVKAGQNGEVSFRETRLGGCTKCGHCDYGGIESVARCAGGDGDRPCRDAIFDKSKRLSIERQLESVERQLVSVRPGSPRWRALQAEARGLRSYLDVTGN